ncbi:DUF3127 domain-containing protein [Parvicella tangerina]|uniref:DUF3127 domain-containing protein n=1 Tax=Parvicella tangerina TaxID=2829795 RepID=A0A916JQP9_9FLAO|nr:DUF3127 domain-containing protein [Parvicella tangerina]CAG5086295.1 hypothetical protein CRYO30217_03073 [Parvicella tangerina]
MSELKLTGKIKVIYDLQTWDSGFSKREFVVTTQEQYPQDVKFEAIKDKAAQLDTVAVGDDVDVSFNVRGNEYNGKYYVNLQAWRIQKATAGAPATPPMPEKPDTAIESFGEEEDDLPF